jgi:hypothetical protein
MTVKRGGSHPWVNAVHPEATPHHCHPMFAMASSKDKTARSFGGLRMTVKRGGSHPWVIAVHPEAHPPSLSS